jgi:Family of unknown function (DUF6790)
MFAVPILLTTLFSVSRILLLPRPRHYDDVIRIVLRYVFLFMVGLSGLVAFAGHIFFSDEVASQIGWPSGSPFQSEVAIANLAFAVLGTCSFWLGHGILAGYSSGLCRFYVGSGRRSRP